MTQQWLEQNPETFSGKLYSLTGVTANAGGIVGVNGSAAGTYNAILTDVFSTGTIGSSSDGAGGIAGYNNGYVSNNDMHINDALTMGTIVSGGNNTGGIVGWQRAKHGTGENLDLTNVMSGMNILAHSPIGGIAGEITQETDGAPAIVISSDSRGYLASIGVNYVGGTVGYLSALGSVTLLGTNYSRISCQFNCGGIVGWAIPGASRTFSITATNYGALSGSSDLGGILGALTPTSSSITTITNSANYGPVTGFAARVGGLVGTVVAAGNYATVTINNSGSGTCSNAGTINGGAGVGGIVGSISVAPVYSSNVASINTCSNSGPVTGSSHVGGVLGVYTVTSTGGGNALNVTGSSNTANVSATGTTGYVGGVVGYVAGPSSTSGTTTNPVSLIGNSSTTGSITCPNCNSAGGLLGAWAPDNGYNTLTIASTGCNVGGTTGTKDCAIDSFSRSPVSGKQSIGGAVGSVTLASVTNVALSVTDTTASGDVTTTHAGEAVAGGFFGAINSTLPTGSMTLARLSASGNVTGISSALTTVNSGSYYLGGFAGMLYVKNTAINFPATITRIGASGNVTGGDASTSNANYGGLIGYYEGNIGTDQNLSELYASGNLTVPLGGNKYIGGLIGAPGYAGTVTLTHGYYSGTSTGGDSSYRYGLVASGETITNSYFAYSSTGGGQNNSIYSSTDGVSWLLSGATSTDANYSGWDFATIWNSATSTTRPTLR